VVDVSQMDTDAEAAGEGNHWLDHRPKQLSPTLSFSFSLVLAIRSVFNFLNLKYLVKQKIFKFEKNPSLEIVLIFKI
jgi:hypothetical protein